MNRRISVQAPSTDQDAFGQPLQTWNTVYECWASIDVQNSQLVYATAEFVSKVTHRLEMRWTPSVAIAPNQRVVYTEPTTNITHVYEIQAVVNTKQANKELVLFVYELNGAE
nr:phage head closure protein [Edaphobacter modestus]